jgi:hypothetical protein
MRQDFRIETGRRDEAECICEALVEYGGEVKRERERWIVELPGTKAPELSAVLGALKGCLDENAIASVKVSIDGQAYAMEGMT